MSKCLAAHTGGPGESYPPYINATLNDDGTVTVIVRSKGYPDGRGNIVCGDQGTITLPAKTLFKQWLGECVSELLIADAVCDEATREILRKAVFAAMDPDAPAVAPRTFVLPGYDEAIEARAKEIYDALPYDEPTGTKPAWVRHGNSIKQDDCRRAALGEAKPASGQCPDGTSFPAGNCEG